MKYPPLTHRRLLSALAFLLACILPRAARAADEGELGFERPGDLPAVKANAEEPLVVEKLRFTDAHTAQGFTLAPIDGRPDTALDTTPRREYPIAIGNGVSFSYNSENGLHLRLADRQGFNLVRVQGEVEGAFYRDVASSLSTRHPGVTLVRKAPKEEGEALRKRLLVAEVKTEGGFFRKLLETPAVTDAVSFFGSERLAEIEFYRVGPPAKPYRAAGEWWLGAPEAAPKEIAPFLAARFGAADRVVAGAAPSAPAAPGAIPLSAHTFTHVAIGPLSFEEGLTAVELDLQLDGITGRCPLTVRMQDPLNGRQELMAADVAVSGAGHVHLILDFPNQVLPDGAYLWLSVAARSGGRIVTGKDGSRVRLLAVPRDSALAEALEYRKLFLKGYFDRLSELWPGDGALRSVDLGPGSVGQEDRYRELFETLLLCRWLGPDDPEVVTYDRWLNLPRPALDWAVVRATTRFPSPLAAGPDTAG